MVSHYEFKKISSCNQFSGALMKQSSILFREAKEYIPGGVNSPVRAFNGVGGDPVFFDRGEGPYLFDVDGNSYIDYVGSWGPMILGHSNPVIVDAVKSVFCLLYTSDAAEIERCRSRWSPYH